MLQIRKKISTNFDVTKTKITQISYSMFENGLLCLARASMLMQIIVFATIITNDIRL